jgi:hypothetical protein
MALKFKKIEGMEKQESNGYDVWELSDNFGTSPGVLGWYFVPVGIEGSVYHDALRTAQQKLIGLGFTELEAKAIIGKQLF